MCSAAVAVVPRRFANVFGGMEEEGKERNTEGRIDNYRSFKNKKEAK